MSYPFLEVLFDKYKTQVETKDDALILFTHWCLISHGFQLLSGNQKTELLPSDWKNRPDNSITMEYTKNDIGYNLRMFDVEGVFFTHLFRIKQQRHVEISFSVNDHVHENYKEFHSAYKNLNDLKKEFHEKIESLTNNNNGSGSSSSDSNTDTSSKTAATTTSSSSSNQQQQGRRQPSDVDPLRDPLSMGRHNNPYGGAGVWGPGGGLYGSGGQGPPFSIGRSDLDPFGGRGGIGGGMNMDPRIFTPQHPQGGFGPGGPRPTPGARFQPPGPQADPYRLNPYQEPDPDHFQPPGRGSDDMYN